MRRSPELLDWTMLRASGVLASRVYAGMTSRERVRVQRDCVRNSRLLDWTRTLRGDHFRRSFLMGLSREEFSHVAGELRKISSARRPRAPYRPPRVKKVKAETPTPMYVGRTHRPCALCRAYVPSYKGCAHWKPRNASGLPRQAPERERVPDAVQRAHLDAQLDAVIKRAGGELGP